MPTGPTLIDRAVELVQIDFDPPHRQPSLVRVAAATVAAVVLSLAADALLKAVGVAIFPSTKGFPHFRFADYSKLTVIGVVIAGCGWPAVARVSAAPRRLYLGLAIAVSAVLLLPDVWLLHLGDSRKAVGVLVAMHLVIAVVTYNVMVRLAPVGNRAPAT